MKRITLFIISALVLGACTAGPGNEGPTIFQGRFIGYNDEYVEFFLPNDDGGFDEIKLNVKPDGTFCDTIQFDKDLYDAPLFADKFMFRICVERGKTYNAEFDLTEEGVETNFKFTGEGEAENEFLKHYWALDELESIAEVTSFKECQGILNDAYAPLLQELKSIPNKPFVKYYTDQIADKDNRIAYYFPFCAANTTGTCPDDADFNAFVKKQKKTDDEFGAFFQTVSSLVPYICDNINATEALKAAASCTVKPEQKEAAMTQIISSLVGSGNINGLAEGYEYYAQNVKNDDYLQKVDELCKNALLLAPGTDAPEIEFEDINGKVCHLSDFRGKPVYVDLWASWCGPCGQEIPYLAQFVEALGKDPEIACISVSIDEERSDWTTKLEEVGSNWPQYIATQAGQESISNSYFVSAIPRFLLIDAEGKIASVNAPRPSDPDILESLKELL